MPSAPATSQASHCPVQGALQQTPSTHRFEEHCPFSVQAFPLACSFSHLPAALQYPLAAQSADVTQVVVQPPPAQRNGAHSKPAGADPHAPAPSQTSPLAIVPMQIPAPQLTPAAA